MKRDKMSDRKLYRNFVFKDDDDREGFKNAFLEHYDLLLNYGLKIVNDSNAVKDCIHDLYLKLYDSGNLKNAMNNKAYLIKALRNIVIDYLNKEKKNILEENLNFDLLNLVDFNDLDIEEERYQLLQKALEQLSSHQKQVIYLKYIKGLSHKEISEILNIKEQSSINLSHRAILSLRQFFKKIVLF